MGLMLKKQRDDDKKLTVEQLVREYFSPRIISYKCNKCKKWNWGVEQIFIESLPKYLILYFDYMSQRKLKYPIDKVEKFIDLK